MGVVPGRRATRVRGLLRATGWDVEPAPPDSPDDAAGAVRLAARGRTVLFVPPGARVQATLRRILCVHGGERTERQAMDAADEAALATGAEILVLHVPSPGGPSGAASLPLRVADHAEHDWPEWADEFGRRFCLCSDGVTVSLRLASGPAEEAVPAHARSAKAGLVVVLADRVAGSERARRLEAMLGRSVCPVLLVPARRVPHEERSDSD